jgi:hypothetical protein
MVITVRLAGTADAGAGAGAMDGADDELGVTSVIVPCL